MPLPHATLCGARLRKKPGRTCTQPAMSNGRCRIHGGLTPAGPALPQFKHGGFSKYKHLIPSGLLQHYQSVQDDEVLLQLKEELVLVDARLMELLSGIETGESGRICQRLKILFTEFLSAESPGIARGILDRMRLLIDSGAAAAMTWEEINRQIRLRCALVESERRRLMEDHQTITADRAVFMLGVVFNAIEAEVPEVERRMAIGKRLRALLVGDAGRTTDPNGQHGQNNTVTNRTGASRHR